MSSGGGRYFACWTDRRGGGDEQIWGAPLAVPTIGFVFGKSTFSQDEVTAGQAFNPAFYINVDGFTNEALGFNAPSDLNSQPGDIPTITFNVDPSLNTTLTPSQINTITANLPSNFLGFGPLPILADDNTLNEELQSFFYPYTITFPSSSSFTNLYGALNTNQFVFVTLSCDLHGRQCDSHRAGGHRTDEGRGPVLRESRQDEPQSLSGMAQLRSAFLQGDADAEPRVVQHLEPDRRDRLHPLYPSRHQ